MTRVNETKTSKAKRLILPALTMALAGSVIGGVPSAKGGVYIVPTDIDAYKQKTDQAYQDLYKSSSFLLNLEDINDPQKRQRLVNLTRVSTPNAMVNDNPIFFKSVQNSVQGAPVVVGSEVNIEIGGKTYRVVYDKDGPVITPADSHVEGVMIHFDGNSALYPSDPQCVADGKYGCVKAQRTATEVFLNVVTGDLTQNVVRQETSRSCSKYGCTAWNGWQTTGIIKSVKKNLNLKQVALGRRGREGGSIKVEAIHPDVSILNNSPYYHGYGKYS